MDTGLKFQGACVYWSIDTSLTQKSDHGLTLANVGGLILANGHSNLVSWEMIWCGGMDAVMTFQGACVYWSTIRSTTCKAWPCVNFSKCQS